MAAEPVTRKVRRYHAPHVTLKVREDLTERRRRRPEPMEEDRGRQVACSWCVVGVERAVRGLDDSARDAASLEHHAAEPLREGEEDGFHRIGVYAVVDEAKELTSSS